MSWIDDHNAAARESREGGERAISELRERIDREREAAEADMRFLCVQSGRERLRPGCGDVTDMTETCPKCAALEGAKP